ncbi:sugar ABC transporter ATP-binding protein [Flexilinea flocculi]|uniref:ABC-type sugar transport system, ATPase component n=1 Tax=Flexilinea flocculi TaxID=1678840 RepID=A0A0K8PBP1_9CHLR|nr:sugar ABC transporter ATP-binding protein [Flexilinea flocculi]GAP39565.1 ABC-type sugar transport system, ATPase component [Flexilinea flocculi]
MENNKGMTISIKGLTKAFAGVKALDNVNLDIVAGKVHGLIGANGAGKSTLIKILAGVYQPDYGEILIDGNPVQILNPGVADSLGLSFIHQELNMVPDFNVIENIMLGLKKERKFGLLDWKATANKIIPVLVQVGFNKSPFTPIKEVSVAEQWLVAIAKALYKDVKLIAMDEPTAALSESEVERLFSIIQDLSRRGIGVIYVSHRLDEVIKICDEITVFKDGLLTLHEKTANLTKVEIITAIAGRKVEEFEHINFNYEKGEVLLDVKNLYDENKIKGVSFSLKKGEVLGLAGLVGSGRTELIMTLFGARKRKAGTIIFDGKEFTPNHPKDAVIRGIALVPENRREEGLITNKTLNFNINLPALSVLRNIKSLPFISMKKSSSITTKAIDKFMIKTNGVNSPILNLSGGNQQKVVIGKWLECNPKLIIMDEPTQGVDVGARAEIYKLIRSMSKEGISFLIVSSDVEELPILCDRVIVMANGQFTGELQSCAISKEEILHLSYAEPVQQYIYEQGRQ